MKITYDNEVDAAYISLTTEIIQPVTRQVDEDINLDFDGANKLVGIEILDASQRLDLDYLAPLVENIGRIEPGWPQLRQELLRRKQNGEPVKTLKRSVNNWIKGVGLYKAEFLSDESKNGQTRVITRAMLEQGDLGNHKLKRQSSLVKALWRIGSYREIE
ncbi:MAG: DUF2283 domain-containing protein [Chloroflexi bacterium]|nr:DUF2283 domain-containing protein [Chloroflexota bacterium]